MKTRRVFANMIWPAILACLLVAGLAAPAAAQGVGDPLSIVAEAEGGQDDVIRTVLLPPQTRSVSTSIPPGVYRVALVSGGPCGTTQALAEALVFTVP
jgi:hypothetical protein